MCGRSFTFLTTWFSFATLASSRRLSHPPDFEGLPSFALYTMSPITQEQLRAFWLEAQDGRLCPWEQAKALGLRQAAKEVFDEDDWLGWVAERVSKEGGGNPSRSALHQFFAKVDADPDWFPGKHNGNKRGPEPLLTPAKRRCISQSAMAAKRAGDEPSVEAVAHACPKATRNPKTKQPFCAKTILTVFKQDCYDFDPDHPWQFQNPLPTNPRAARVYGEVVDEG